MEECSLDLIFYKGQLDYLVGDGLFFPKDETIRFRITLGGREFFFLLKWCDTAHSLCSKMRYNQPKNQQISRLNLHNSKNYPDQHVSTRKKIHLDIQGGSGGGLPPRSRRFFLKNQTK